jgi:amidase
MNLDAPHATATLTRRRVLQASLLPSFGLLPAFAAQKANVFSELNKSRTTVTQPSNTSELAFLSATSQAQLIREKSISSEELVTLYLDRIDQVNPCLNAVVALADNAVEQARNADALLAEGKDVGSEGKFGPLHGVPMTIKDCFDTAGVVSTWGTMGRRGFVPDQDATVVARLKAAGAILIGKTNTPEFTLSFETHNKIHGFTNNPHDLARSPGGSSGGAAAAIAAGLTSFDIGTDYGGSIRVPAHCCGTVGIKPTSGSVARTGLCLPPGMLTDSLSHAGPLARYVEDLRLILPIIWGPDAVDTRIADVPFPDPSAVNVGDLSVAVMFDNGIASPSDDTLAMLERVMKLMAEAGISVRQDRLDGVEETTRVGGGFWAVGAHASVKQLLTRAGTKTEEYANNWFKTMDGAISDNISAEALNDQLTRFESYRSRMQKHMSQYDVLISPVNANPAQLHPQPGEPPFPTADASYTEAFDLTGWPSGVVRGGTSTEGLPIGVQVTANPWREDVVLAVMAYLERSIEPFMPPALRGFMSS